MSDTQKKFLVKVLPEDVGGVARTVVFTLGNGVQVVGCLDSYTPAMVERLAIHGLSQKIGDAASGFSKERDFHGAFGAMQGTEDNLQKELWSNRTGGGTSDLVQVLAELQGVSVEQAQGAVDAMDEAALSTVKKHPAIKKALADLVAKRAKEAAKGAEPIKDVLKSIFG